MTSTTVYEPGWLHVTDAVADDMTVGGEPLAKVHSNGFAPLVVSVKVTVSPT